MKLKPELLFFQNVSITRGFFYSYRTGCIIFKAYIGTRVYPYERFRISDRNNAILKY